MNSPKEKRVHFTFFFPPSFSLPLAFLPPSLPSFFFLSLCFFPEMVPLSGKNNFLHRDRPLSWKCKKNKQLALTLLPRLHLLASGQMKTEWQGEVYKTTLVTGEGGVAQSGSHLTRLHLCPLSPEKPSSTCCRVDCAIPFSTPTTHQHQTNLLESSPHIIIKLFTDSPLSADKIHNPQPGIPCPLQLYPNLLSTNIVFSHFCTLVHTHPPFQCPPTFSTHSSKFTLNIASS